MQNTHCITIKHKTIGAGTPAVCVPLVGNTEERLIGQARTIVEVSKTARIDIAEFRGDFFEGLGDLPRLRALINELRAILGDILLLFTIRSSREGGETLGFSMPSLTEINRFVIENALADLVDVELFSGEEQIKPLLDAAHGHGVQIIMSNHDFAATPSVDTMVERLCRMQELGADIAKIAVMPQSRQDVLALLSATERMYREHARIPLVTISMGTLGAISRVTGEIFGSAMTFAAIGRNSAPGQIPVCELSELLDGVHGYCVSEETFPKAENE